MSELSIHLPQNSEKQDLLRELSVILLAAHQRILATGIPEGSSITPESRAVTANFLQNTIFLDLFERVLNNEKVSKQDIEEVRLKLEAFVSKDEDEEGWEGYFEYAASQAIDRLRVTLAQSTETLRGMVNNQRKGGKH